MVSCEKDPAKMLPIEKCDGLVAVPATYMVDLRHYQKDVEDYAKAHCK